MSIYVAEIEGRGIAAFSAENEIAAKTQIEDEAFRADLVALENESRPLLDGKSEIFLREAFPEEADRWRASHAVAKINGGTDDDDWLMFLVPISDPAS